MNELLLQLQSSTPLSDVPKLLPLVCDKRLTALFKEIEFNQLDPHTSAITITAQYPFLNHTSKQKRCVSFLRSIDRLHLTSYLINLQARHASSSEIILDVLSKEFGCCASNDGKAEAKTLFVEFEPLMKTAIVDHNCWEYVLFLQQISKSSLVSVNAFALNVAESLMKTNPKNRMILHLLRLLRPGEAAFMILRLMDVVTDVSLDSYLVFLQGLLPGLTVEDRLLICTILGKHLFTCIESASLILDLVNLIENEASSEFRKIIRAWNTLPRIRALALTTYAHFDCLSFPFQQSFDKQTIEKFESSPFYQLLPFTITQTTVVPNIDVDGTFTALAYAYSLLSGAALQEPPPSFPLLLFFLYCLKLDITELKKHQILKKSIPSLIGSLKESETATHFYLHALESFKSPSLKLVYPQILIKLPIAFVRNKLMVLFSSWFNSRCVLPESEHQSVYDLVMMDCLSEFYSSGTHALAEAIFPRIVNLLNQSLSVIGLVEPTFIKKLLKCINFSVSNGSQDGLALWNCFYSSFYGCFNSLDGTPHNLCGEFLSFLKSLAIRYVPSGKADDQLFEFLSDIMNFILLPRYNLVSVSPSKSRLEFWDTLATYSRILDNHSFYSEIRSERRR